MLTRDQAAGLFSHIKKHSTADEVEAYFYGGRSALTRFANNVIHQNVADENYGLSVRSNFGGRTARASTNKLDEDSLKRVVLASENLAKVQHPDAEPWLGSPKQAPRASGYLRRVYSSKPVPFDRRSCCAPTGRNSHRQHSDE